MSTSDRLTSPPPTLGADGALVRTVVYMDDGPHLVTGTTIGPVLSDAAWLAQAGEDLQVLLPGRGVNPQKTPLRRKHGCQVKSLGRHVVIIGGQIDMDRDWTTTGGVQSIFLKSEAGNHRPDFVLVRNVLSARYGGPGAWFYLMPDPFGESCPLVSIENVSMQPAPMWGPDASGTKSQPRVPTVLTSLANNVWPSDAPWVGDLTQLDPAAAYSQSSVLRGTPGMGYVNLGYGDVLQALVAAALGAA